MSQFLNIQSFASLPTCSAVPGSGSQLINKTYGDGTYALSASVPTLSGSNTFTGSNIFNNNPSFPTGATVNYVATCTNATTGDWTWQAGGGGGGGPTLAGANAWTGTNTYNTNLPTSTITPTSSTQLITKTYGDTTYGSLGSANAWTSTNTFNSSLPTSTVTPTTSTQLVTKTYVDTNFVSGGNVSGTSTAGTPVTLVTLAVPNNSTINVFGLYAGNNTGASISTSGMISVAVTNVSGTLSYAGGATGLGFYVVNGGNYGLNFAFSGTNFLIKSGSAGIATIDWNLTYFTQTAT